MYTYVFDRSKAEEMQKMGYKYILSQINGKEVYVFQTDSNFVSLCSSKFEANDFVLCDKLIF